VYRKKDSTEKGDVCMFFVARAMAIVTRPHSLLT